MSQQIKEQLKKYEHHDERSTLVDAKVFKLRADGVYSTFAVLTHYHGVSVWLMGTGPNSAAKEICYKKVDGARRSALFYRKEKTGEGGLIIAVAVGAKNVQFFDCSQLTCIGSVSSASTILNIDSCGKRIVIVEETSIAVVDWNSFEYRKVCSTRPSLSPFGTYAVGADWVAYCPEKTSKAWQKPKEPVSSALDESFIAEEDNSFVNRFGETVYGVGSQVLQRASEEARRLGTKGMNTLSKMMDENVFKTQGTMPGNNHTGVATRTSSQISRPHDEDNEEGWIVVRDLPSGRVIVRYRAHSSPVAVIRFDPSGALIASATVYGQHVNIFRVVERVETARQAVYSSSAPVGVDSSIALIGKHTHEAIHSYKLVRGMTHAMIRDISFSANSRWVAVTSARVRSCLFRGLQCSSAYSHCFFL